MRKVFRFKKSSLVFISILACMLILFGLFNIISMNLINSQRSQQAAKRWKNDDLKFAQITAILSSESNFNYSSVLSLRSSVDNSMKEINIEITDDKKVWYDAFSTEERITLKNGNVTSNVNATVVGGNFFRIHELDYITGYAFSPDDIMQDRIILDTLAAWQLFGSYDVVGKIVNLNDTQFTVAGVVNRGTGNLFEQAYGSKPRVYMSYDYYQKINPDLNITCWEAVIPSPISGWAESIVKNNINAEETDVEIIDNSARYSFLKLLNTMTGLPIRSMKVSRIIYPYWENIAGVYEDYASLLLLGILIFGGIPAASAVIFVIVFIIRHPITKKQLSDLWYEIIMFVSKKGKYKKTGSKEKDKEKDKEKKVKIKRSKKNKQDNI